MKKVAVVLSGCGVYDGAEIHEATLTLLAIAKHGLAYDCFAPDIDQFHVVDHISGNEMEGSRNVLVESARIARGKIEPLAAFDPAKYDGLVFPGGFGVAKNLSDWAFKGADSKLNEEVESVIKATVAAGKPIGALCISPVLLAKALPNAKITIGNEASTVLALESIGAQHVEASHGEVVVDYNHKIVTTPCYMLDANIVQIAEGAENVIKALVDLM